MDNLGYFNTPNGPLLGVQAALGDMTEWHPTVGQMREVMMRQGVIGTGMLEGMLASDIRMYAPTQREVGMVADACVEACRSGRLIDFGHWTNQTVIYSGARGGPLYAKGMIGHPFGLPYILRHTWEGGVAAYLVVPMEPDKLAGGEFEAVELQPLRLRGDTVMMIGDRIIFQPTDTPSSETRWKRYRCAAVPSLWRFGPHAEWTNKDATGKDQDPGTAAGGNVLDPVAGALLILSTRGIVRETVRFSEKLQKARAKHGKPPIPPYDLVNSTPYVTAIENRRKKGRSMPKGGTHASPIPHLRMGHLRTNPSGRVSFVRDSLVNMTEATKQAWQSGRSHYEVR